VTGTFLVILLLALPQQLSAQSTITNTYSYTGAVQTFVVPITVDSITVDAIGASGGNGENGAFGGLGGRVQSTIPVTPGETLYIYVGQQGTTCGTCNSSSIFNGGGGTSSNLSQEPGAGGGATDIRSGGTGFANRILVAGAGGGGGFTGTFSNGGAGGSLTGANGSQWSSYPAGTGGTQSAGGTGGDGSPWGQPSGGNGAFGLGGAGQGWTGGGGGGGGGYYGGGGGLISGGGGGSSYILPGASNIIHTQGYQSGNGSASITYTTYCTPIYTYALPYSCSDGDIINNFSTTGGTTNITNNGTGCSVNGFGNYTNLVHTEGQGESVSFSIQSGLSWANGFAIWVDWNNNYTFESTELMWSSGSASTSTFNGSFTIPFGTPISSYRMRIRSAYNTVPTDPCSSYTYGETEEYTIAVESPYCTPTISNGCALGDYINNFSTSGGGTNITNNGSGCNGSPVGDYTSLIHTSSPGESVGVSVQSGPTYAQGFRIYVDWNKDGVYASTEEVWNSGTWGLGAFTGSFDVPCSADTGTTYMRVICNYIALPPSACGSQTYGEAEDYTFELAWDTTPPIADGHDITVALDATGSVTVSADSLDSASVDNCGLDFSLSDSIFNCADTGDNNIWFYATDAGGNVDSDLVVITVLDTSPPTVITQNIFVQLAASGSVTIDTSDVNNSSFDNCAIASMQIDFDSFTCADVDSTHLVILTVFDVSGNSDTAHAYVTVTDILPPTVVTQNDTVYLDSSGDGSITVAMIDNGTFDNCTVDSMYLDVTSFDCSDTAAPNTIYLYAEDVSGNVDSAMSIITVFDTTRPIVLVQSITVYLDSFGNTSIVPGGLDNGSSDNCTIDSTWLSMYDFDCGHAPDSHWVAMFVRDISGNLHQGSAYVTVLDTVAPQPIIQNLTIYLDSTGEAVIDVDSVNLATWDSCGLNIMYLSQDTFNCIDVGSNNVTFYAEDVHGNIDSAISTIQVNDTIAPVIVIVDTQFIYLDSFGFATTTADSVDISTSDACGIDTISIDTSSFDCANHGDTLNVLFTATDENGNTSYDSLILVIEDTLAPYIFAHSDTVYLDSSGQFVMYAASLDDSTHDNCTLDTIYLSDTLYTCSTVDSAIDIIFNAEDIFGNQSTDTLQVAVMDTIHPIITCNDSIIVLNDSGDCVAIVDYSWPTAWDNCSIDSIIQIDTTGLDSGSFFPLGFTQLTYVAYDQSLNTDTCSFIIEVQDWEAPQLFCQNDTTICDSIFTYSLPIFIDNCTYHTVVLDSGIASGGFYPVGLTINRFIVTDIYGNADTCQFEVFRYDYPDTALAGIDQEKCEEYDGTMAANNPAIGFGFWTALSGNITFTDSTSSNTAYDGLEIGITQFEWRIENGVCPVLYDTMEVEVYLNPIADAGDDVIVCDSLGAEIAANLGSIGIGTWLNPGDGTTLADTNEATTQIDGLQLGTYSYRWMVINGVCPPSYDDVTVDVVPFPVVETLLDTTFIFAPSSVEVEATSDLDVIFEWWPNIGLTNGDQAVATVEPATTTTYYINGTTADGCKTTDTILVEVNEGLKLPTAFTPDGDRFNDVWNLKELANYPDCAVKIYNRWGNEMFASKGYQIPWDGTFNGKDLPSGSYFFVVELGVPEVPPITGSITIIR
jgi:gliding motility-associated-like protein